MRKGMWLCLVLALAACGGGGGGTQPQAAMTPEPITPESVQAPQQAIADFSPKSGPAGTVIVLTGSGFTGSSAAWVGNAHDAALEVVSDRKARITVPAGAGSGAVAILNPLHAAFSASSFTVTGAAATPSAPVTPTTPSVPEAPAVPSTPMLTGMAIRAIGNRLVDAAGATVQLRGVNYSGFESAAIQGWIPADPSGAQAGQAGGPKMAALASWKTNALRIPLNEASWLGYACTDAAGVAHNPDPGGNYRAAVKALVEQALAARIYVILDLHWTAPGTMCPMLQTQMADADHSLAFWTSVATEYKAYPGVIFELFNEPFADFDFSGDAWAYFMQGAGGSFSGYPATSGSGAWKDVKQPWKIASYQAMLNAVRATGAANVVLVGGLSYSQDLSGWLAHRPVDPLGQMGAAWHPYRKFGTAWDYPYPNFYPQVFTDARSILAAGIPLVMTEVGGQNTAGTAGCPIVTTMAQFADANGASVLGWGWDVWGEPENVLIKDGNGAPTDGYGQALRAWMLGH